MHSRSRFHLRASIPYLLLLVLVIPLGLATRRFPLYFPAFMAEYGGDTLWALTAFLLTAALLPRKPVWALALISGLFSLCIELSQLCEAAWLNRLRDTVFGALVLGRGWLWTDLLCYAVGILMGILIILPFRTKNNSRPPERQTGAEG